MVVNRKRQRSLLRQIAAREKKIDQLERERDLLRAELMEVSHQEAS